MPQFKFFVQPGFDAGLAGGSHEGEAIGAWFLSQREALSDALPGEADFAALSERLLLAGEKDFLVWDDLLKAAEMTYFADQTPLPGPSIDFCCGYGFWTSRILGKIDVGVDLFPDDGSYQRSIEGFVARDFIGGAYRSVLRGDVTAELPLPSAYFQSVVAVCSLEHIEAVERTLATMVRILKPGGKLYLSLQTDRYIRKFAEIFHPDYVGWLRDEFTMHVDRSWREWEELIARAGLAVEERRFILPEKETAMKALTYWKNPFDPVLGGLELGRAVREIPEFRRHYYDLVRSWSRQEAEPDEAAILCLTCTRGA